MTNQLLQVQYIADRFDPTAAEADYTQFCIHDEIGS